MKNRTVLITGSTDGIGMQTAKELAFRGANVLIHGKNKNKAEKVASEIIKVSGNKNVECLIGDFSSIPETKVFADEVLKRYKTIDVLINNAGVLSKEYYQTKDGYERTFVVNYISAYILTLKLLKPMLNSEQARIIFVSSISHSNSPLLGFNRIHSKGNYSGYDAYSLTKLCQILFTYELALRISNTNLTANALHPGMIGTKLLRDGLGINGASIEVGAVTPIYLASDPSVKNLNGKYFVNKNETKSSPFSYRDDYRKKLMEYSQYVSGISIDEIFDTLTI